ncbi:uncharacterized protein BJX67DRAFT_352477 [Aspergillus lucknowensis]|uniref:Uncharacterized protein n=1 Tax=Aspergillus lucknowensis TaxID=176173 RepID=A0ABR4LTP2_9EURO
MAATSAQQQESPAPSHHTDNSGLSSTQPDPQAPPTPRASAQFRPNCPSSADP